MINSQEWLRSRRKLLDQVKMQVELRLGALPKPLRAYARAVEVDYRAPWRQARDEDLKSALAKAKVVLGGDFHAYAQSQRAHVRILRELVGRGPVVLGLECLNSKHDGAIEDYLRGRLSESKFLSKVEWDRNWGFPWEHYRPLFELARDRGFKIFGLNPGKKLSLTKRDAWTAKRVLQLQRQESALVYVVIGEWHLAKAHLPNKLKKSLATDELITLFQDVEPLYFRLALKQLEARSELLKASDGRFCLMVSPPWMKWQSYLMYLEHAYDRDLQEDLSIDYSDHIVSLVELLEQDLGIQTRKSRIQVYCPNSRTSLTRLKLSLPKRLVRPLTYHLEHDLSFFLPERDWLYLSRPTINHASQLAGQFVHAHLSRRKMTLWDLPNDFLPLIWVEAVSFFFSKWINPKRKAESLDSIRLQLAAHHPKDLGRKPLLLALDHRLSEVVWVQTGRLRPLHYRPKPREVFIDAARLIGSMMGERLFQRVRSKTISLQKLMKYLKMNVESDDFERFYWQVVRELESN